MWIEKRGRQYRVYYRTGLATPKKALEPFPTREMAEYFIKLLLDSVRLPERITTTWPVLG